jgi:hypothetical protein
VDDKRGLGVSCSDVARAARVIEMHVRQEDVVKINAAEELQEKGYACCGPSVDQRGLLGAKQVDAACPALAELHGIKECEWRPPKSQHGGRILSPGLRVEPKGSDRAAASACGPVVRKEDAMMGRRFHHPEAYLAVGAVERPTADGYTIHYDTRKIKRCEGLTRLQQFGE